MLTASCGVFGGGGGDTRRVLVDFKHDEFGASFLTYFPNEVRVHPGDTVAFRQHWSGEAHTVTMGTLVDTLGKPYWDILDAARKGEEVEVPEDEPDAPGFDTLPVMIDQESEKLVQAAAQPCYRDSWVPRVDDLDEPCPPRAQPEFDGRQAYYSSGFIPFEGDRANAFTLPLSDDILPGTYHYYCNYHGPAMSGVVEVVPKRQTIPDQTAVNKTARAEAERFTDVLAKVVERQRAGRDVALPIVGGYPKPDEVPDDGLFMAFHNEFVPKTFAAKVGEPVTWTFYGGHTLSFNVPKYFPVFTVREDGFVTFNPDAFNPVGWPDRPEPDANATGPPSPAAADAGAWDGSGGLRSTGWDYGDGDTFSVTFTQPGTYHYACLLHPTMVGEVVVS